MLEVNSQLITFPITGDIVCDEKTGLRKRFTGVNWRPLCRVENCLAATFYNGLCHRHKNVILAIDASSVNKNTNNTSNRHEEQVTSSSNVHESTTIARTKSSYPRLSRELRTIVDGQTFLLEQNDKERFSLKRNQPIKNDRIQQQPAFDIEPSLKRSKNISHSLPIENHSILNVSNETFSDEIFNRITTQLTRMHENLDICFALRDSMLSPI